MKNNQDVLLFIEKNKQFIGFGNYTIALKIVFKLDCLAKIFVDEYDQKILLTIPRSFFKHNENQQKNILLHELMHGRESLKQQRVEEYCRSIKQREEEVCINDITTLAQNYNREEAK
jgi:hypothetical protein